VPEAQQQCLAADIVRRLEPAPAKPEIRAVEF
jgi:hypothetical protein